MIVKAKKIPRAQNDISAEEILARFCYHFPQYTYVEAKKLPYKRVVQMLRVQRKEEARIMYQLAQITAAPHTKEGVKNVTSYYQDIINE